MPNEPNEKIYENARRHAVPLGGPNRRHLDLDWVSTTTFDVANRRPETDRWNPGGENCGCVASARRSGGNAGIDVSQRVTRGLALTVLGRRDRGLPDSCGRQSASDGQYPKRVE